MVAFCGGIYALSLFGSGFGWFRALEGSDFLEELLFLRDEVCDLFALLGVEGLV